MPDPTTIADERFEVALEETGARDPREHFRERLKALRSESPEAFQRATRFYQERVVAAIADGEDPIAAWRGFGIHLAEAEGSGRTVQIDPTGRSTDYAPDAPPEALVLFLPERARRPAFLVGAPRDLSPAQRATSQILLRGTA